MKIQNCFFRLKIFSILMIFSLLFASCEFFVSEGSQSSSDDSRAYISVNLSGFENAARNTINPEAARLSNLSDIKLSGVFNSEEISLASAENWDSLPSSIELYSGTWTSLTFETKLGGASYKGIQENITINKGETKSITFSLEAESSEKSYGGIDFTLNLPDESVKSAKIKLETLSSSSVVDKSITVSGKIIHFVKDKDDDSEKIETGAYRLYITLYGDAGKSLELNTYKAAVNIAAGRMSTGNDTLENISEIYTISFLEESGAECEFESGTVTPTSYTRKSEEISLPTPKNGEAVFGGWYSSANYAESEITKIEAGSVGNCTFYAKWILPCIYVSSTGNDSAAGVTEKTALKTLSKALILLNGLSESYSLTEKAWTIQVNGEIACNTIISEIKAQSLSIQGKTGSATDILNGDTDGDGTGNGTVLTISTESPVTLKNLTIQNGTSGLYVNGSGLSSTTTVLSNCNIKDNTGGGGIKINSCGSIEITGGTISGNSSSGRGGGISISDMPIFVSISDGTVISGNTAATYGGGIDYTVSGGGTLMISDCEISSNTATANSGGGIYADIGGDGAVITSNLTLKNNHADSGSGGGIYATDSLNSFRMTGGTISDNSAKNGGGVSVNTKLSANPLLSGVTVKNNTASENGGGIQVTTGKYLTVEDCTISENTATKNGGGIYAPGKLTVTSGTISGNSAENGGGIYSSSTTSHLTLSGGTISGNRAMTNGGGVYNGGTVTMSGGTISGNTATENGGGVYNGGTVTMSDGARETRQPRTAAVCTMRERCSCTALRSSAMQARLRRQRNRYTPTKRIVAGG